MHCWASRHLLGFEDEKLGSSPGWRAATVATYCPSRPGELLKFLSSKPWEPSVYVPEHFLTYFSVVFHCAGIEVSYNCN